jgi:hypothetical protein
VSSADVWLRCSVPSIAVHLVAYYGASHSAIPFRSPARALHHQPMPRLATLLEVGESGCSSGTTGGQLSRPYPQSMLKAIDLKFQHSNVCPLELIPGLL